MKYNVSHFLDKLIEHEGMVLDVYKDSLGIDTIGIGRNLKDRGISKDELDYMDIPNIDAVYQHGISEADARYLAMNDIRIVEDELCRVHSCVEDLDSTHSIWVCHVYVSLRICGMLFMSRIMKRHPER